MTGWMGAGTPEGHRDVLTIAAVLGLFVAITVLLVAVDSPADGVGFLYVLPVGLVAVGLGWRWGVGAAALCFASYVLWTLLGDAVALMCQVSCWSGSLAHGCATAVKGAAGAARLRSGPVGPPW